MRIVLAVVAAVLLSPAPGRAVEFSCKDAASFYYLAMLNSKLVRAVSGSCSDDLQQPACIAFMEALKENGADLEKAKVGSTPAYFGFLNDHCPDDFPKDPEKF